MDPLLLETNSSSKGVKEIIYLYDWALREHENKLELFIVYGTKKDLWVLKAKTDDTKLCSEDDPALGFESSEVLLHRRCEKPNAQFSEVSLEVGDGFARMHTTLWLEDRSWLPVSVVVFDTQKPSSVLYDGDTAPQGNQREIRYLFLHGARILLAKIPFTYENDGRPRLLDTKIYFELHTKDSFLQGGHPLKSWDKHASRYYLGDKPSLHFGVDGIWERSLMDFYQKGEYEEYAPVSGEVSSLRFPCDQALQKIIESRDRDEKRFFSHLCITDSATIYARVIQNTWDTPTESRWALKVWQTSESVYKTLTPADFRTLSELRGQGIISRGIEDTSKVKRILDRLPEKTRKSAQGWLRVEQENPWRTSPSRVALSKFFIRCEKFLRHPIGLGLTVIAGSVIVGRCLKKLRLAVLKHAAKLPMKQPVRNRA